MTFSVAHVTTIGESLEILLLNQLGAIRRAGYDVTGVSAPGPSAAKLEAAGLHHRSVSLVRATGLTPFSDARTFAELVRLFRRERYTIVHTHTAKPDLYATMAARAAGVPIVITTLHGFYFHDLMSKRKRQFYATLARIGMTFCDAVLSQNPEDVETAKREHLCAPEKIEYLGNGIDVDRFDPARYKDRREQLRRAHDFSDEHLVVGYVGRMVAEKGVLELFEAAKLIRERIPNVRFLFVGTIDEAKADAIRPATADAYGIGDICTFTGQRDDIPDLMAAMDVSVLASHREGFPRTVMEASAMELPVVATNIRGCRTAVDDGRTGFLVPLKDVPALAESITKLLASGSLRRTLGEEGRRVARARFDEKLVFARVLSTYERLLAARGLHA